MARGIFRDAAKSRVAAVVSASSAIGRRDAEAEPPADATGMVARPGVGKTPRSPLRGVWLHRPLCTRAARERALYDAGTGRQTHRSPVPFGEGATSRAVVAAGRGAQEAEAVAPRVGEAGDGARQS